jgi:hypothetical protein
MDTPMGEDVTLHDLLASNLSAPEDAIRLVAAGERLAALLRALRPAERAVFLALADPGIGTWTDAALHMGNADPEAFGEKVRRNVRRTLTEQDRRRAQMPGGSDTAEARS